MCVCVSLSLSIYIYICESVNHFFKSDPATLWTVVRQAPWDSPSKNNGEGCHALLQRTFPTQGANPRFISPALAGSSLPLVPHLGRPRIYIHHHFMSCIYDRNTCVSWSTGQQNRVRAHVSFSTNGAITMYTCGLSKHYKNSLCIKANHKLRVLPLEKPQ